jgi:hypothetical protein
MVNLISNEPKTGCYLLPILSNLQAPIFKNNAVNAPGSRRRPTPGAAPPRPLPFRPLRPQGPLSPLAPPHADTLISPDADTPPASSSCLLDLLLELLELLELLICIFPPYAAC